MMPVTILSNALITTAEAKERLGITVATYDDTITAMINSLTVYAENYIGREIKVRSGDTTEYIDVKEKIRSVWIKNFPIVSLTSVTEDGQLLTVDSDFYKYDNTGEIYAIDRYWTRGRKILKIIYKGGYATVPEDIKEWALQSITKLYKTKDIQHISSESVGDLSVTYKSNISESAFDNSILKSYKANYAY